MHRAGCVLRQNFLIRPVLKSLLENVFASWFRDETNRCQQNLRQQNLVHRHCESNHFNFLEYLPTVFIARRRCENSIKKMIFRLAFTKISVFMKAHFPRHTFSALHKTESFAKNTNHGTRLCQFSSHNRFKNCSKLFGKCRSRKFHATRLFKHECALKTRSKQSRYRLTKLQPHSER